MGRCQVSGCSGHADATVAYMGESDGGHQALDRTKCCRKHALEEQMSGDPPVAVRWSDDVGITLRV